MEINRCVFPEGFLYDLENFVWIKNNTSIDHSITIGITPVLASIAGRLSKIRIKQIGAEIEKGKSIATLESPKYFGVVRSPLSGKIIGVNESIVNQPKIANDFPYTDGWFAKLEPHNIEEELGTLETIESSHDKISSLIKNLGVRCFVAFPDYEMVQIGIECAATLTKLDELLTKISVGEVVHIVSDDSTADLEMIRWSEETGQSLLEVRTEGNLFHFIVKKIK
jgi:glycine cleavage system H lipoate-binding protein/TusA-related sulfurtransferase